MFSKKETEVLIQAIEDYQAQPEMKNLISEASMTMLAMVMNKSPQDGAFEEKRKSMRAESETEVASRKQNSASILAKLYQLKANANDTENTVANSVA